MVNSKLQTYLDTLPPSLLEIRRYNDRKRIGVSTEWLSETYDRLLNLADEKIYVIDEELCTVSVINTNDLRSGKCYVSSELMFFIFEDLDSLSICSLDEDIIIIFGDAASLLHWTEEEISKMGERFCHELSLRAWLSDVGFQRTAAWKALAGCSD